MMVIRTLSSLEQFFFQGPDDNNSRENTKHSGPIGHDSVATSIAGHQRAGSVLAVAVGRGRVLYVVLQVVVLGCGEGNDV